MADGERESVCGIFWFGWGGQAEEGLDHLLHLPFARPSTAGDRELGPGGWVFEDWDRAAGCGEDRHPFRHAEFQCALRIFEDELRFDGEGVGAVAV